MCDNDTKGRKRAQDAAKALRGGAKSIRVVLLPGLPEGGGDVSDWLDAGNSVEELYRICLETEEWTPAGDSEQQQRQEDDDFGESAYDETPPPQDDASLDEWDAGEDDEATPPRGWLLGSIFCRGFISSLLGDGAVGKTALRYAQLLSLASGRPLTGEHVFQRCRVLIVSMEDGKDELRRRIKAARLHHGVELSELKGWLFLAAPGKAGGKLLVTDHRGRPVEGSLATKLERAVTARKIDIVSLDPFVKTHSVEENNNSAIDDVVQILTDLSIKHDISIDIPHHMAKGAADPGNANRGRGASAMKDAGRLVYTLTKMSEEEAKAFGLSEFERCSLIRMDNAKVNIAPPRDKTTWFRLVGVRLENGTELYPNGDEVQTVEPWTPPDTFADVSTSLIHKILDDIEAGLPDGSRYTDASRAEDRRMEGYHQARARKAGRYG